MLINIVNRNFSIIVYTFIYIHIQEKKVITKQSKIIEQDIEPIEYKKGMKIPSGKKEHKIRTVENGYMVTKTVLIDDPDYVRYQFLHSNFCIQIFAFKYFCSNFCI